MLLSFDTSTTSTGYAVYDKNRLIDYGNIDLKSEKNTDTRIRKMVRSIWDLLEKVKPKFVVAETTAVTRNAKTQRYLTFVLGSVVCWCSVHNVDLELLPPTKWRKLVGYPKGRHDRKELKEIAIAMVKDDFGVSEKVDDVAEAILIGKAGVNYPDLQLTP